MIDFQPEDRTQQRLVGGIATLIYAVSVLLLLLLLKFQLLPPPDNGEGLMINFGNVEEAAPGADLAMNDQAAEAPQQPQQQAPPQQAAEDEQLTQDFEETDVVVREKKKDEKKTPKKEDKKVEAKPKPEQKPVEKPREVNRKALFPGRTEGSKAASEGTGTGAGNQGNPAGTPEGSHEGTGTGTGNSASLSGRSLVGMLPKPDYSAKDQGRVVIEIMVDQQGKVTAATYRSKGSTTQNSSLVNSALQAARRAQFNVDENAPVSQSGTITYNFRMQ